jgi:hypothetical protein
MSEDWGFAAPPFDPEQSLLQLQRAMRDAKLSARGKGFELRGKSVIELEVRDATIAVRLVRRLAATPEWDLISVKSANDQRKLVDEVKRRLARWLEED